MKTYKNLKDLINSEAGKGSTPGHWGKSLYKYTACGPWVSFAIRDQPARTEKYLAEIFENGGRLHCRGQQHGEGRRFALPENVLQFLGFTTDGDCSEHEGSGWNSLDSYYSLLDDFQKKERQPHVKVEFDFEFHRAVGCIRIELTKFIEGTLRDIYYEREEAWQEDWWEKWGKDCVGIEIGSIVEGAEVCVGPEMLTFPFTNQALKEAVEGINDEASFYWDRDNSHWYMLYNSEVCVAYLKETWGETTWACENDPLVPADDVKSAVEKMVEEGGFESYDEKHPVPGHPGWELAEYCNDATY